MTKMPADNIIGGPYEFGDAPPQHLMGWAGPELAERAYDALVQRRDSQMVAYSTYRAVIDLTEGKRAWDRDDPYGPPIWQYAKKVHGQHLPTPKQETGDCVSMGCASCVNYRHVYEIGALREEEKLRLAYQPFIYGMSRTAPDLGNGQLGRGGGSTGAWGAGAIAQYGVLFVDDPEVPPYAGTIADKWGFEGPPDRAIKEASDNHMTVTTRLRTLEEVRHELINYRPVTIASTRGFAMQPRKHQGFHVFKPEGSWAHQMCLLAWMDEPFAAAYRLNSWGENAHGSPLNNEPPGGAWNLAEDIEREIRGGDVELYACSVFEGDPGEADPGLI